MKSSKNKVTRYRNLIRHVQNWPDYLLFKSLGHRKNFLFQLRDSFSLNVDRRMLPSFKESFFDNIYLRAFSEKLLQKTNPVIVDVGANVGFFSINMFYYFPQAKVLAYEPVPYNFQILQAYQNAFPNFNLQVYQEAVGGEDTTLKLNLSKLDGYTTMASIFESDSRGYQIEVPAYSLETLFKRQKLNGIDLLKLDCEGAEYQILYNAPDHILSKISKMSIETHKGKDRTESLMALRIFLGSKGFVTEALEEGKYSYLWAWKPSHF